MRTHFWGALLALTACSGAGSTGPDTTPPPPAYSLGVIETDTVAVVGHTVPVVVRLVDANNGNAPLPGVLINFRVVQGNGSVFAGTALTDTLGQARELYTIGTVTADSQVLEARAVDPGTGLPLVYARAPIRALPGPLTQVAVDNAPIRLFIGDSAYLGTRLLSAKDQYGNATTDTVLTWDVPAGWTYQHPWLHNTAASDATVQWHLQAFAGTVPVLAIPNYLNRPYTISFTCNEYQHGLVAWAGVADTTWYPADASYNPLFGGLAQIHFTATRDFDGSTVTTLMRVARLTPDSVYYNTTINTPLGVGVRSGSTIVGGDWCAPTSGTGAYRDPSPATLVAQ